MKHLHRFAVPALCVTCVALLSSPVLAEPPPLMPLQGYLTDSGGTPLDGDTSVQFRLYDAETDGTMLHEETQTVAVDQGHFTVYLGTAETLALSILRDNADVFLGIAVEDDDEATPRLRLATAPFAASAAFCGEAATVGGMSAADFAASDHTHPAENAATLCESGQYLDGDGTCHSVSNITDTNAGTLCSAGQYLDGDGTCQAVPVDTDTNTNAETLCSAGQYLDGDGSCRAVPTDTDTNTNAQTICGDNAYLRGDGRCLEIGPQRYSGTIAPGQSVVIGSGVNDRGVPVRLMFGDSIQQSRYAYFTGMAQDGNTAIKGFVFETGRTTVSSLRLSTTSTAVQYTAANGWGQLSGSGTQGNIEIHNNRATEDMYYVALFGPSSDMPW